MKGLAVSIAALFLFLPVAFAGDKPNGQPFTELQSQIDELGGQIDILTEQLNTVQNDMLKLSEFAEFLETPTLIVNDITFSEDAGDVQIPIALTRATIWPVHIDYQTVDGTALAGPNEYWDYGDADHPDGYQGTVIFDGGETLKYITIHLHNDFNATGDDIEFSIVLSNPLNVNVDEQELVVTISEDDLPWVYIGGVTGWESTASFVSGTTAKVYSIDVTQEHPQYWQYYEFSNHGGVTVVLNEPTPDSVAIEGEDFVIERTIYIPPGDSTGAPVTGEVINDSIVEAIWERAYFPVKEVSGARYYSGGSGARLIVDILDDDQ